MADLTTLESVCEWLGLDDPTDNSVDDLISRLISSESGRFVDLSGNPIAAADYTETRNGNGTRVFVPSYFPVLSVVDPGGVTVDGVAIPKQATSGADGWVLVGGNVELVGYVFNGASLRDALPGFVYSSGTGNVTVKYRAGYETIPADVSQAVCEMVALKVRAKGRIGLASQSVSGESASFAPNPWAEISSVINAYRRPGC